MSERIPKAKEAVDGEWDKLDNKTTWNTKRVQPRAKVIRDAERNGKTVHFGTLTEPSFSYKVFPRNPN